MNFSKRTLFVPFVFLLLSFIVFPFAAFATTDQWTTVTPSGTTGYSFNTIAAMGDYVYLGTDHGVYKSTDAGLNWTQVNTGLTNQSVNTIAIGVVYDGGGGVYTVDTNTPVFVGTAAGLFKSTLGTTAWTSSATGLTDTNVKDIEIDQYEATQGAFTHMYASTPSGVFRSDDTGSSWTLKNTGMSGAPTKLVSDFGNGLLYSLTATNKIFSTPMFSFSGVDESWTQIFSDSGTTTQDISMLNPLGSINWVATDKGILKSDPTGATWTYPNEGLATTSSVNMVASDYTDSNIAYAALAGDGVYRTANEALTSPEWLPINKNLSDLTIKEVRTNPGDSTLVYAVGASGVYKLKVSDLYVDLTPPSTITDLSAVRVPSNSSFTLNWTAPGNDGIYGTANLYTIKYSSTTINAANWTAGTTMTGQPTPQVYGHAESFSTVSNTLPADTAYFAIKASDTAGNESAVSNAVFADGIAPTISAFTVPTTATSKTVTISALTATDVVGVTGYLVAESNSTPVASDSGWTSSAPTSFTFTNDGSQTLYAWAKDAAGNVSSAGSQAVTITLPSSGGSGGGGTGYVSSGGGGGGGGGGASSTPAPTIVVATTANGTSTPGLTIGGKGIQVILVQLGLILQGMLPHFTLGTYDATTANAVAAFQKKSGIVYATTTAISGYGIVDSQTQAKLNVVLTTFFTAFSAKAQVATVAQKPGAVVAVPGATTLRLTRTLKLGSVGDDVRQLQVFLNARGFTVATSGNGSVGHESTYYGPATAQAVKKFQEFYASDILTPLGMTQGNGAVGNLTFKKINSMK